MKRGLTQSFAYALFIGLMVSPASGALKSGVYQTLPGATVMESGDRVTNETRIVPMSAIVTRNLDANTPSLTAVISDAVLEGGAPFPLTVRSSFGARRTDGSYVFRGDYLRELQPTGTQYGFDWNFSASSNGGVIWDGTTAWLGGHAWYIDISNLTVRPGPTLEIAQSGSQVTVSWSTAATGYALETAAKLAANNWDSVTNSVETVANKFSVTLEAGASQGYFRLRKL